MRNLLVIAVLIFVTNFSFAQEYVNHYNEGVELFKQEKYKEADSLLSLAIEERPENYKNPDMFFDRALIKVHLQDTSGYCINMRLAADYNDQQALKLYKSYCLKYDSIANSFFVKGLKEFESKNYKLADSLLTLSINLYEYNENVLLRGITRLYMDDTSGFCSDMDRIYRYDERAQQNFQQICNTNKSFEFAEQDNLNESEEEVFFVVENMPKFNGKNSDAFRIFIQQNLRYPIEAERKGLQGRIFVQFDVNTIGEVKNVKVVKGVGKALDNEAVRVVSSSPKWSPGLQRGKPVTVRFTFPIVFQLQ